MKKEKWEIKKLGECFDIIRNGANIKQYDSAEGVPITRIETLANDTFNRDRLGYANIHDTDRYRDYFLKNNDILISHINSTKYLGRAVLYKKKNNENIIHGMNLLILSGISSDILPKFIFYYFKTESYRIQIYKITKKAVNQASFTTTALKEVPIPVPPLPVQEQIVKELDTLHRIKELQEQQLVEYDNLAQSTFYSMFGDPIENEKGWEVKKLGEVCDVRDGTHDSPVYIESNGYPLITSKNLTQGFISFENVNLISEEDFNAINKRSKVDVGDILMPMIGTVGNPIIVNTKELFAIKNVALIKFGNSHKVINLYIQSVINSASYKNLFSNIIIGGTQKFISLGTIRSLLIPIPPLSLQTQFAERIEKIESQKELVKQGIAETQMLIDYTMDKYFG